MRIGDDRAPPDLDRERLDDDPAAGSDDARDGVEAVDWELDAIDLPDERTHAASLSSDRPPASLT